MKDIQQTLTLVDGSLIAALPKLMQASVLKNETGSGMVKWRLHNSVYEVLEERALTEADREAGVLSDQIVRFTYGPVVSRRFAPLK